MSIYKKSIFFIFGILLVASCSTNKDRFVNRNFHAITAEYNILYNGNLALEEGKEQVAVNYTDNYWDILPVERMQLSEKAMLPGQSKNQKFQRAEKKAAKAIQKHGMYIDGREHNPQMDEAFLLLGKARYYDQRFIPALEAFNYILSKYPTSNNIAHANIWREKTNIRLNNNELAIKNLKEILKRENSLKEQDIADASAMLAQAYIKTDALDSAVVQIAKAAKLTEKDDEKGRYIFIKGQLLDRMGEIEEANAAFDEVIALNRKSPRVYMINAYIEKAKNFDFQKRNPEELLVILQELAADRENRSFLDIIYHQLGEYYRKTGATELAVENYNKSLRTRSKNQYLHAQSYKIIGNINFDAKEYQLASAYFDSTLTKLSEDTREYRSIKKKRDNLADVVLYENIANRNDSILGVAKLSEADQYAYFTRYTNELKRKTEIAKEAAQGLESSKEIASRNISNMSPSTSSFYFYNEAAVGYGLMEFKRIWGDIALTDNWRFSPVERTKIAENEAEVGKDSINPELDPKYHPGTYIAQIPTDPEVLDSLEKERNFAYYQLGVIYKEKLDENGLAIERFEALLDYQPQDRLILPSKYNLYQLYKEEGNSGRTEFYKKNILNNHSDSRYAAILRNPESLLKEENKPAAIYAELYDLLENEKYKAVIDSSEVYITRFNGDPIVPKLEFLKARAKARLFGFDAYKEALNFISLNYPQSDEGKKAQDLYKNVIPRLEFRNFEREENVSDFKLLFSFSKSNEEKAVNDFEEELKKAIAKLEVEGLETSVDIYNQEQQFVVIHNLKSALGAKGLAENLVELEDFQITKESYPISTENYQLIQIHKNFDHYLNSKK